MPTRTAKKSRGLLSQHGWTLIEHRDYPDSFGNECLVMAKDNLALRLVIDRDFAHVDPAGHPTAAEADWIPLEVAALAVGRIDQDEVRNSYRNACDFEHDTGQTKAEPLFESPVTEVLDHEQAYANILTNRGELATAHIMLTTVTTSVLDEVTPDLLDSD